MAKELKEIIVGDYTRRFGDVRDFVVIDYQGLNSEETADLRNILRDAGISMNVVHNRLALRTFSADDEVPTEFRALLRGPSALLYGEGGVLAASKSVVQWIKKNKGKARVKGGLFQGQLLSEPEVGELAKIPDHDTLRGRLAATLLGPLGGLVSAIGSLVGNFAGAVESRRRDLESQSQGDS